MDEVVLVLGAAGQVGRALTTSNELALLGRVVAVDRAAVDLTDVAALRSMVRAHNPRVIVNAAAYTAVDRAEQEPALAEAVNATAPAVLAEEAESLGAALVHYSTDYVFDGTKAGAYVEEDVPDPLSVYGRTKLAGERAVAAACRRQLTLRTSWVFSEHGANFPRTMLRLASEREHLRVVADQWGAPTSASLLARVTAELLRAMRDAAPGDARWGTYHVAAAGETNWHAYARLVVEAGHGAGLPLRTRPEDVVPIRSSEYPVAATRPANSRLDTSKVRANFPGVSLPHWTEGVRDTLAKMIP